MSNLEITNPNPGIAPANAGIIAAVNTWSNSFWRLTVPEELLNNSKIHSISDEGCNLLQIVYMYGDRTGRLTEMPWDQSKLGQSITDLAKESLWLYDSENIPQGLENIKRQGFYIETGKTSLCHRCGGSRRVKCWKCDGRGSVEKKSDEGYKYYEPCTCSGGYETCNHCFGFGWVKQIISVNSEFKLLSLPHFENKSPVPNEKLAKVSGKSLFEEIMNYPQDLMRPMLRGGVNSNEYALIQNHVKNELHKTIDNKLKNYDGNIKLVHEIVDHFFPYIPNPAKSNVVLEHEVIPVRLKVKVESKMVYRVNYTYKSKNYSLWVFGSERNVFAPFTPREFTKKAKIFSAIIVFLLAILAFLVFIGLIWFVLTNYSSLRF